MDYFHERGVVARAFVAFHNVVDDVIPVLVGALLGIAVHYVRLRSRLAREQASRSEELRARVEHVERDQAVWVVAAATLHELKNPLHTMGLLVDELEATPADDVAALHELRVRLRTHMDRALVPLDALRQLAVGRRSGGASAPVVEVAERVVSDLSTVSRETGVELRFEPGILRSDVAYAEVTFLRIILENLIGNSLETLRQQQRGGHIQVRMLETKDSVSLDVSDDGPGLTSGSLGLLFHPLETAKESGLGLGLAISRALARAMNGELAVASAPGWSTTFRLTLPLNPRAA
jgi:signal transduction histidine kinase